MSETIDKSWYVNRAYFLLRFQPRGSHFCFIAILIFSADEIIGFYVRTEIKEPILNLRKTYMPILGE